VPTFSGCVVPFSCTFRRWPTTDKTTNDSQNTTEASDPLRTSNKES